MAFSKIAGTGDIKRKMLACAIDVSETETPEYVVVGYKITSSALELNPDIETGVDINGVSYSSVNKLEMSQTFDPHRLRGGELGVLGAKLLDYVRFDRLEKFSQFKVVLVYGFLEPEAPGQYVADLYDACTIVPQSIGGESWADMPFDVNFGGTVTRGHASGLINSIEFTPTV